jgi:multiple sugar transport system permease protein
MIPGLAVLIPLYVMLRSVQLIDTYVGYILPLSAFLAPFVAWMMMDFFRSIPTDLEDSAFIDGCSRMQTLRKIILPLSAPGLVASGLWCFLVTWGEFMFAVVLTGGHVVPLSVEIATAVGQFAARDAYQASQGVIALAVPVALALAFQKYITKGLLAGSIKG